MPTKEQVQALLDDYVTGSISDGDKQLLLTWLKDPDIAGQIETVLQEELEAGRYEADPHPGVHARLHARIQAVMSGTVPTDVSAAPASLVRRIAMKRIWWVAAAVLILLLGAGLYRILQPHAVPTVRAVTKNDVPPGGNKAVLTLADGSTIVLDSAANGTITSQGTMIVTKKAEGELVYRSPVTKETSPTVAYHTLSTPAGGQYQLQLPDGSKVWLNAASSIRFPTAFAGNTREVAVTGEVYFEVAKNPRQPFGVTIQRGNGAGARVEVLGTHFNINAYDDEAAIYTTLLEGKVKVVANGQHILSPGQQLQLGPQQVIFNQHPDLAQVMAWKNGAFSFENRSLQEVMRQLARWYDIEVVYEGKIPVVSFAGEMGRDVPLSKVLAFLQGSRIHFRLEGTRKLVITH